MRKPKAFQQGSLAEKSFYCAAISGLFIVSLSLSFNHCSSAKTASETPAASPPPGVPASVNSTEGHGPKFIQTFEDCKFDSARVFVQNYCAACHSQKGTTANFADKARRAMTMDTYAEWMQGSRAVPGRIVREHLMDDIMPPPKFPAQPTDEERKTVAEWVRRGSPNTESGR